MGGTSESALRAELMANAVATAHNHVLRRWLRGDTSVARAKDEVTPAMADVVALFEAVLGQDEEASLIVLRTTWSLADFMPALRQIADHIPTGPDPDRDRTESKECAP